MDCGAVPAGGTLTAADMPPLLTDLTLSQPACQSHDAAARTVVEIGAFLRVAHFALGALVHVPRAVLKVRAAPRRKLEEESIVLWVKDFLADGGVPVVLFRRVR